jgi:hypothetical protein
MSRAEWATRRVEGGVPQSYNEIRLFFLGGTQFFNLIILIQFAGLPPRRFLFGTLNLADINYFGCPGIKPG